MCTASSQRNVTSNTPAWQSQTPMVTRPSCEQINLAPRIVGPGRPAGVVGGALCSRESSTLNTGKGSGAPCVCDDVPDPATTLPTDKRLRIKDIAFAPPGATAAPA